MARRSDFPTQMGSGRPRGTEMGKPKHLGKRRLMVMPKHYWMGIG